MTANHISGAHGVTVQAGTIHGPVTVAAPHWRPPPVPRQLPPDPPRFTNRRSELAQLHRARRTTRLLVLVGIGGVGKTSLAVRACHDIAEHYPDGHLHLSLGGGSGSPVPPGELLGAALRGLGVAAEFVPHTMSDRVALYRSLTHSRRILVLADDAATTDQIRPLIPSGADSVLVATARTHLPALLADGAAYLRVDPLPESGATELLRRLLPGTITAATNLAPLTALCAGMPLALCTAAALMAITPDQPIETVAAMITRHRSTRTGPATEVSMHTGLSASYSQVPDPGAQRLYRLLGLHPGTRYTAPAAAALADTTIDQAHDHLVLLTAMSLTHVDGDAWTMHDVTRNHARDLAAELPDEETNAALDRLFDHYLLTAAGADRALNRSRWRLAEVFTRAEVPRFTDRAEALAWWDAEGTTVRALVKLGWDLERYRQVGELAETCKAWGSIHRPYEAWEEITGLAVASATALGDTRARAYALLLQAAPAMCQHQFAVAASLGAEALSLWRALDDPQGTASSLEVMAVALTASGRPEEALPKHQESIELHEAIGKPRGIALQRRLYARSLARANQPDAACEQSEYALEGLTTLAEPDPFQVVQTLIDRVAILLALGRHEEAEDTGSDAVREAQQAGHRFQTGAAMRALADVAAARERPEDESRCLRDAHDIFAALHAPEAAQVTDRLTRLGPATP
ncbi:putative ATPase [Murinocardiopsis flavida]|uniref:Putative ATPase n=1 Tax=Murinocardiopsis flavida TaxID=645275 RepID=A0A2P8CY70_9ACTN|nr:tetratricopeptide repeat protein [Murinocardiopsis flavida]PSK89908.1 putative ATPase [Murinocardiopsis flavida]